MNKNEIVGISLMGIGTLTLLALAIHSANEAHKLAHENATLRKMNDYKQRWIEKIVTKYVDNDGLISLIKDVDEEAKFFNIVNDK